ncbi:hypothetical protein ACE6H2_016865 [Prunus campanulata]
MSRATSHRLRDRPCRDQRSRSIPPNGPVHIYPVRFIMKLDNHQINGTDGHDWNKTDKLFIWLVIAGPALRQNPRGSPTGKTLCGVGDRGSLRFQPKASLSQPFLLIQTVRFAPSVD